MTSKEAHIVSDKTSLIEWAAATLAKEGEQECADLFLVKPNERGVLLAAVDGLGHGSEARQASQKVINMLETEVDKSLIALIEDCHEEIKGSRGVVLSIARINSSNSELSWLSVGNVEGILMNKDAENEQRITQLVLRSGVVGYTLPSLRVSVEKISAGDVLFFTTDGVMNEFAEGLNYNRPIKETVKDAVQNYFKKTDDSLILAVRLRKS